jgi:hypothetical protein
MKEGLTMKTYEIVGYCLDGESYCTGCLSAPDTKKADPIFAGSEWDYYPTCGVCGGIIDEVGLTTEGIIYQANNTPNIELFFMSKSELAQWYGDKDSVWYDLAKEDLECSDPMSIDELAEQNEGYYWWSCCPGCLPDSDPNGPFLTELSASEDILGF